MSERRNKRVEVAFDRPALKRICEMHETQFGAAYDMTRVAVDQSPPDDYYFFKDNGADILAVAHLDTVIDHERRICNFIETAAGPIVYSGALDDRLGAYIILELLPLLGVKCDILLTVGEETGRSTAAYFEPGDHHDREYNWMIEFDRGGTDVVMYQYDDDATRALVRECGAKVEDGIFSDISYMEHLGIKGFNWGVGYRDYHGPHGHAYLDDTTTMVGHFLKFHEANAEVSLPHEESGGGSWWGGYRRFVNDDERMRCDQCLNLSVDYDTGWCEDCGTCNFCWYDGLNDECKCKWAQFERDEHRRAEERREIESVWLTGEAL
jgi:hypothetical protein